MKNIYVLLVVVFVFGLASFNMAISSKRTDSEFGLSAKSISSNSSCTNIQSGLIKDSQGNPLTSGYDKFGYNYQAHMFNGTYDGSDRNLDGTYWGQTGDFVDDKLMMKWSDEWLSNVDCNGDHLLDRGLVNGVVGGISLGWLTNQITGDYTDFGGNVRHFTDFVKIVWTGPGSPLWGQYSVVQEVLNDPAGGYHGLLFKEYGAPGFGLNDHWTELP